MQVSTIVIVNVVQTKKECASPISVDDPHSSHFLNLSGSMVLCCCSRLAGGNTWRNPENGIVFGGAGGGHGDFRGGWMAGIIKGLHDKNDCESSRCTSASRNYLSDQFCSAISVQTRPWLGCWYKTKMASMVSVEVSLLDFLPIWIYKIGAWSFSFYLCIYPSAVQWCDKEVHRWNIADLEGTQRAFASCR